MSDSLQPVAFDIETSGFQMDDVVTVAGFRLQMGTALALNTNERSVDTDRLEANVERVSGVNIRLYVTPTEREFLDLLNDIAENHISDDHMLVAFNGETWNGGFDLPFLRTRVGHYDEMQWPFDGLPYADLMPLFHDCVNTVISAEGDEASKLPELYDSIIGGDHCDPFTDSAEATTAWETGDFEDLLLHNLADIERTQALANYAHRVVPRSDFRLKNLSPP